MSEFGDSLKATARSAIGQVLGVTKAAGTTVESAAYMAVIDLLCDQLGNVHDRLGESNKVLRAISRDAGSIAYPQEWKAWRGEVPINGNGHHHRGHDGSSNDGFG